MLHARGWYRPRDDELGHRRLGRQGASVVPNAEGARTTPSVVAFTENGERLVGQLARRQAILNAKGTIYSVKRFVGRRFEEVEEEAGQVTYDVVPDANGLARIKVRDKLMAPEEISALILRKLADDAGRHLGERVTEAVITVPAYFNDAQRTATRDAGKIAGLEVLRIINEPTAAALAYGMDKGQHETVLVFDLGGGTFDVSVLDVGDGVVEVRATAGDTHLGGDDFDRRIVDHLAEEFQGERHRPAEGPAGAATALRGGREGKGRVELGHADPGQPALRHRGRERAEAPHDDADALDVRAPHGASRGTDDGAGPSGHVGRQGRGRRRRRGHPGRRVDPDPGGAGARAPADRWQGTEHDRQPRRGRGGRRRDPGGGAQGRGLRRPPARCHAAVAGWRPRAA